MNMKENGGLRELQKPVEEFDKRFRTWVCAACKDWGYAMPAENYFTKVYERLPEGLRTLIGLGINSGIIISKGRTFTLKDLPHGKGPYNWFSHDVPTKEPTPNWEYFVQVAEFVRFYTTTANMKEYSVTFEDDTMDIAIYKNGRLFVYCEVKEKITQIQKLIKDMKAYESAEIDLSMADRHNDPLRKAKCIVKRKPEYFVGVAIGAHYEYGITHINGNAFELLRDTIPLVNTTNST